MHPLVADLSTLKDTEIETRIQELSRKYFQTYNVTLQHEIAMYLDAYKLEMATRNAKKWQDQYQKRDTDLDNLINVS
jgi:hypothetical protein